MQLHFILLLVAVTITQVFAAEGTTTVSSTVTVTLKPAVTTTTFPLPTISIPQCTCANFNATCRSRFACAASLAKLDSVALSCSEGYDGCVQHNAPVFLSDRTPYFTAVGCQRLGCSAPTALLGCYEQIIMCTAEFDCKLALDNHLETYTNCTGSCIQERAEAFSAQEYRELFLRAARCVEKKHVATTAPNCFNGVMDGQETSVDCGGSCTSCSCFNGVRDGTEEGVDCGGATCYDCKHRIVFYDAGSAVTSYPPYGRTIKLGQGIEFRSAFADPINVSTTTCINAIFFELDSFAVQDYVPQSEGFFALGAKGVGQYTHALQLTVVRDTSSGPCPDSMEYIGCRPLATAEECQGLDTPTCNSRPGCQTFTGCQGSSPFCRLTSIRDCQLVDGCAAATECVPRVSMATCTGLNSATQCTAANCSWVGCASDCSTVVPTLQDSCTITSPCVNTALASGCRPVPDTADVVCVPATYRSTESLTADDFCYESCQSDLEACFNMPTCNTSIQALHDAHSQNMLSCSYTCQLEHAPNRFTHPRDFALFFSALHCYLPCMHRNWQDCDLVNVCPQTASACQKTTGCLDIFFCLDECIGDDCNKCWGSNPDAQQAARALRGCKIYKCYEHFGTTNPVQLSPDDDYRVSFNATMESVRRSEFQAALNTRNIPNVGPTTVTLRGGVTFNPGRSALSFPYTFAGGPFFVHGKVNASGQITEPINRDMFFVDTETRFLDMPSQYNPFAQCDSVCQAPVDACMNNTVCAGYSVNLMNYVQTFLNDDPTVCGPDCFARQGGALNDFGLGAQLYFNAAGCFSRCVNASEYGKNFIYTPCNVSCFREQALCYERENCSSKLPEFKLVGSNHRTDMAAVDYAFWTGYDQCVKPSVTCPPDVLTSPDGRRDLNVSLLFQAKSSIGWKVVEISSEMLDRQYAYESVSDSTCNMAFTRAVRITGALPYTDTLNFILRDRLGNTVSCTTQIDVQLSATATKLAGVLSDVRSLDLNSTTERARAAELVKNQTTEVNVKTIDTAGLQFLFETMTFLTGLVTAPADLNTKFVNDTFAVFNDIIGANKSTVDSGDLAEQGRALIKEFAFNLGNGIVGSGKARLEGSRLTVETVKLTEPEAVNFTGTNDTTFSVPEGAFSNCTGGSFKAIFTIMTDTTLFEGNALLSSLVVSATLPNCNTTLSNGQFYIFTVKVDPPVDPSLAFCSFYDEDEKRWVTTGLKRLSVTRNAAGLVTSMTCASPHLTNFAALVDSTGQATTSGAHGTALSVITLVCSVLSCIGLFLTIVTHSSYKRLRQSVPSHLLLCLAVALLLALVLFIIASEVVTDQKELCQATAVLLQYFWLSAMAWMVVQSVNLYAVTVIVLGLNMELRLKIYHACAWGFPLVITALSVGIAGIDDYGDSQFCWINDRKTLIGGFLVPLAIMIVMNVIGFGLVFATIHRTRIRRQQRRSEKNEELDREEKIRELRAGVSLFFLLGVSWIFGALIDTGDGGSSLAFQYIFAITATLQGFMVFVFHCIGNPQAMEEYRRSFSGGDSRSKSFSSGKKTASSDVSSSSTSGSKGKSQRYVLQKPAPAPTGAKKARLSDGDWERTESFQLSPMSERLTDESTTSTHPSFIEEGY